MIRRIAPWLFVGLLMVVCTSISLSLSLARYDEFRLGYGWDLAYFNQWFWAVIKGYPSITVRPLASYAVEGPSPWKMNYLSPLRFLILPIYAAFPDPRTLLVIESVLFWWVIPAGYVLVKQESGSSWTAMVAAALIPLTPLLWPLVLNDFRELQVGIPFIVWAFAGWRARNVKLSALGIAGLLACRQEFAFVVASLALVPPRETEDVGRTYRWSRAALVIGLGWFLFLFFGYLAITCGIQSPRSYLDQFEGPKPSPIELSWTILKILGLGLASWSVLALFAPRVALVALPWLFSLASGKWTMDWLSTHDWHHVRYTAPAVGVMLAAGLIGYARIAKQSRLKALGIAALGIVGFAISGKMVADQFARVPVTFDREESAKIWRFIRQVDPDDGVMSAYELTAALSSRRHLYSYVLDSNKPPDRPEIHRIMRWMFLDPSRFPARPFEEIGFEQVYKSRNLLILHRAGAADFRETKKFAE